MATFVSLSEQEPIARDQSHMSVSLDVLQADPQWFKIKAFIMAQSGNEAASKSDVTSLDTKQDLDFDNDTLKAIVEVYKNEGNEAYLKEDYVNAVYFYTEGIKVNCKDQDLKGKLYSKRAYAYLRLGAKASVKLSLFELAITFCYKGLAVSFCSLQLTACMLKRSVNNEISSGFIPTKLVGFYVFNAAELAIYCANDSVLSDFKITKTRSVQKSKLCIVSYLTRSGVFDQLNPLKYCGIKVNGSKEKPSRFLQVQLISVWLIRYNHCKLIKLTFFVPFTKNGIFRLTKCGLSPKSLCILRSVTLIMVKTYNCSCKRLQSFIWRYFYRPFLGSALGLTAMCSLGWGNLVAFDWNDLPVGREFDCKFLKKVKSPPYALPPPPPALCFAFDKTSFYASPPRGEGVARTKVCSVGFLNLKLTDRKKKFQGDAYVKLGAAYGSLCDFKKAIKYSKRGLSTAKQSGDRGLQEAAYINLGYAYQSLGDSNKKAIKLCELGLSIVKETGNIILEGMGYSNLAVHCCCVGQFSKAEEVCKSSIKLFEEKRVLQGKDEWKISLRNKLDSSYTLLWNIQLQLGHTLEALFTAEAGRAQALVDLMESQYGQDKDGALKALYDVVIAPISPMIEGEELVFVPDRYSFLIPYAALVDQHSRYLSETLRIRLAPSLTCLRLLSECPEGYHSKSGALLVGNPCLETVRIKPWRNLPQLPGAEKEVKMIGQILNIEPLVGKDASKEKVLSGLSSVSLVHIAAHGCPDTGGIILSPNLASSDIPEEKDFLLTMADVLEAQLHAKLVVLSCCYSGQGAIKAEGVVGIARAFLGAGARSVIASLWAISDDATMEFMGHFYEHLVAGKSASKSLHQAMKTLRESGKFDAVKYWAPFVLIGDDVTMNFAQ
ncbi:unnamed protein product [Porites evermanni]|uniref:CHAT domain-containing protein n=1 Tax=Porites evermanni TaxID=104178 RepID=A0ABN8M2B2_9CNID|nr:unnamed protein product [Porites evermanni]